MDRALVILKRVGGLGFRVKGVGVAGCRPWGFGI